MRAKLLNEFERGRNPKKSLGLGLYRDNPLFKIDEIAEKNMKDPENMDFSEWSSIIIDAAVKFPLMIIKNNIRSEFGVEVETSAEFDGTTIFPTEVYLFKINDINLKLIPAKSGRSWNVWVKTNTGTEYRWKHFGSSYKWTSLRNRIKKLIVK